MAAAPTFFFIPYSGLQKRRGIKSAFINAETLQVLQTET
jgi:hypothetical protein